MSRTHFSPVASADTLQTATVHLTHNDPVLAQVIGRSAACDLQAHENYYEALVDAIISQQLSIKAAATIQARFCALFDRPDLPSAPQILTKSVDELRSVGLSNAKARYVRDLAEHCLSGTLSFDSFKDLSNDAICQELTAVNGIGIWTAHMFLIFCMGRLDVLPVGDLGIKNGLKKLYGLGSFPDAATIMSLATDRQWHPYESVASWYVWRSLELPLKNP